jgi:AraC family transcriptional regulator
MEPVAPNAGASVTESNPKCAGTSRRVLRQMESTSIKLQEVEYAAGFCVPRHSHPYALISYTVAGVYWSAHGSGGHTCRPRSMRFLPCGERHENYFPIRSRCLLAELPAPFLELAREHDSLLKVPGEISRRLGATLGAQLYREFRKADDLSEMSIEGLLLELLIARAEQPAASAGPAPQWLGRVREMLHENKASRLTLMDLARCAGRHPVQVCRQFHSRFGCTISSYVRRVRVARAQSLLDSPDLSIAEIALTCGFSDQSHFTAAFRRLTGMPPRRYRTRNDNAATRE